MRPIDADALIQDMEMHVTTMSVCLTTIEARAKTEMKRTCISDVANAPTIDAIPVEWIETQIANEKRAPLFRRYAETLLTIWQNEQEEHHAAEDANHIR